MARLVYTLGELKGSVGGLTFQKNSSGKIVRQRPNVSKSSSIKQQVAHQRHIGLLESYQLLSPANKDLWNTYASTFLKINKFGESKQLTGQNWYESINYQRLIRDIIYFESPPAHTLPPSVPMFEILITPTTLSIARITDYDFTAGELNIWTTIPTNRQTPSVNQIRKYVGRITGISTNPLDITNAWKTATGLDWLPFTMFPTANIFICLESVSSTSYITSAILCAKENVTGSLSEDESIYYY